MNKYLKTAAADWRLVQAPPIDDSRGRLGMFQRAVTERVNPLADPSTDWQYNIHRRALVDGFRTIRQREVTWPQHRQPSAIITQRAVATTKGRRVANEIHGVQRERTCKRIDATKSASWRARSNDRPFVVDDRLGFVLLNLQLSTKWSLLFLSNLWFDR